MVIYHLFQASLAYWLNLEHQDYLTLANKFKPVEDLNSGNWNKDKFRKYTIDLERHEGILFYVAERETSHSTSDSLKEETITPKEGENNSPEEIAVPSAPRHKRSLHL